MIKEDVAHSQESKQPVQDLSPSLRELAGALEVVNRKDPDSAFKVLARVEEALASKDFPTGAVAAQEVLRLIQLAEDAGVKDLEADGSISQTDPQFSPGDIATSRATFGQMYSSDIDVPAQFSAIQTLQLAAIGEVHTNGRATETGWRYTARPETPVALEVSLQEFTNGRMNLIAEVRLPTETTAFGVTQTNFHLVLTMMPDLDQAIVCLRSVLDNEVKADGTIIEMEREYYFGRPPEFDVSKPANATDSINWQTSKYSIKPNGIISRGTE